MAAEHARLPGLSGLSDAPGYWTRASTHAPKFQASNVDRAGDLRIGWILILKRRFVLCSLLFAAPLPVALSRVALAEDTAPPAPTAPVPAGIVPPRILSSPEVAYPPGAEGDAVVVLTLTINADGGVRSAKATETQTPFSLAAERAAAVWRFEPATRGGRAVASVVHFEVRFVAPELVNSSMASAVSTLPDASNSGIAVIVWPNIPTNI